MADINLSFAVENGISLDDVVGIFAGSVDPSVTGEDAPLGSLFVRNNGQLYQKIGPALTDWIRFTQGLGEGVKISATDTVSNYLNSKLLVSSNLSKVVNNPASDETLTLDLSDIGSAGTYRSVTVDSKGRVTSGTNPTTLAGYGIVDAQPLDSTLTALSTFNTNGILVQTGPDTFAARAIDGTTNQLVVSNGTGVASNPTLAFSDTIQFPGTTGVRVPIGTTAERVATSPYLRFNSDSSRLEYFTGSAWISVEAATGGTVTSISTVAPAAGFTISGSPITTSGTLTFSLSNDLAAVEGLTGTGFAVRTGSDAWGTRTIAGTTNRIVVSNGDGTSANPTIDIAATYAGQSSISTVGTITSGTWAGTTIATNVGGTGRTTIGSANQFLAVNTTATGLEYKTVLGSTGIGINLSSGQLLISNTGVTTIAGTADQVITSAATGAITLSLPQSIGLTSTPTFNQITLAADPTTALQVATKQYVDTIIQGIDHKQSVKVATTANITLSGTQTIDGDAVVDGDRVLVKDQGTPSQNGIYVVAAGAWTRALDMDNWAEVPGAYTFVEQGTVNADLAYLCTSNAGGTLDTTAITWVLYTSGTSISAGTGLTRTGNTIFISSTGVTAGSGYNNFTVNAQGQITAASTVGYLTGNQTITLTGDVTGSGTVSIPATLSATGVTAGTYRSVTVDAKGRVTAATNPTTLAGYGITDAQPLDGDLTAIAAFTTTGFATRVGTNSWAQRSIVAGSTKVSVVNGDGVGGNPTVDVTEANLALNNIGGTLGLSKGGTGLTTSGTSNQVLGMNAAGTALEYKTLTAGTGITINNTAGSITISSAGGTVTSVAVSGSTGLTVGGSPITTSGTITLTLGTQLQGLSALSANGIVVRTASGVFASRSVVSGAGTITITNPAGTAGNIGIDLTTVGTAGTYRSVTTDAYGRVTAGTNPTTLAGYGITDAINISEKGAANGVATLDSSGLIPASQLPPLAISDVFTVASQAAMLALTAERGDFAVRTDLGVTFVLSAEPASTLSNWVQLNTGASGTVTSVAATAPAAGFTISGSPITTSGTFTFALADDLAAVEGLATTGIAVRTGTSTWATRSITAGTGISVTNGTGVGGNITIAATNNGTVTSVGLALPSIFSVSGSPVTTTGTLTAALANQAAATFFAGPVSGGAAAPSFRTIALDEMSDVVLTSPSTNQVLAYNGSNWVNTGAVGANAAGLVGVGQAGAAAWALVSGSVYRADFAHNLGTTNVVITVFNSATNAVVIPQSIVLLDNNTVRITVVGNTLTLKVVVVANGQSIVAGGSTPSSVIVAKDGVDVATATRVNFTGQAVGVTNSGGGTVTVGVGARFTYFANSLDTPVNSDFVVNSLSPSITDPTYNALNVRSFSNTVEQGVATLVSIPPGMTNVTFKFRGRPTTAPGAASVVQMRLYHRRLPNNAAVPAWSAAQELANISIPTNANFQYSIQTVTLASLGLVADSMYQFEFTRRVTGVTGTNLSNPYLLAELTVEFS